MTHSMKRIRITEIGGGKIISIAITGTLEKSDYEAFVPEMDRLIEVHGKIRILLELEDFHGWTGGALWEDTKFAARHFADIDRLAIVGDARWEKGMAAFCRVFTTATVRYFDHENRSQAKAWISEGIAEPSTSDSM